MKNLLALTAVSLLAFTSASYADPINVPPPSGALMDLAGQPLPGPNFTQYTANFTALGPLTAITLVMRSDPQYLYLDDVSVTDLTTPAGEMITNGNFEADAAGTIQPTGWTYANPFAALFTGALVNGFDHTTGTGNSYQDGSVQAYDDISQIISTTVDDTYSLSFWVATDANEVGDAYRDLSDNGDTIDDGGNAIDVLAYATYPAPTLNTAPEPASLAILGVSLLGIRAARRRRRQGI